MSMIASPTRVVMKALTPALRALSFSYQKPIRRYEQRPMISQKTKKVMSELETTSPSMPVAKRLM